MTELIAGIKVIKLYAWEGSFFTQINANRVLELRQIQKIHYLLTFLSATTSLLPIISCCISLVLFIKFGGELTPQVVFPTLAMFTLLVIPIDQLPQTIFFLIEGKVYLERFSKFLKAEEIQSYVTKGSSATAIEVIDGNFSWQSEPSLTCINVNVKAGEFVAIVGSVGSGKSSILSAILGEMHLISGKVSTSGTIALCSQQAWLQCGTVRDNIVFSSAWNKEKYEQVIQVCQLQHDFDSFSNGDMTVVGGEGGVSLSGGQKQRINLARLVYHSPDVLLFDDPLSAVDARIGNAIYKECFESYLSTKTRVLVTNHLHLLENVDKIIVLDQGSIAFHGTFKECMNHALFRSLLNREKETLDFYEQQDVLSSHSLLQDYEEQKEKEIQETIYEGMHADFVEEKSVFGAYSSYFKSAGGAHLFTIGVIFITLSTVMSNFSDVWLSLWSSLEVPSFKDMDYISVYVANSVLQSVLKVLAIVAFSFIGFRASLNIFTRAFNRVMRCTMPFFDSTPLGQIISRLCKDQKTIDYGISYSFYLFLRTLIDCLLVVLLASYYIPLFIAPLLVLLALFYFLQLLFRKYLKRAFVLESNERARVFEHVGETLAGTSTIKSFNQTSNFFRSFTTKLNGSNDATETINLSYCSAFSVISIFGNILVASAGFICIFLDLSCAKTGLILGLLIAMNNQFYSIIQNLSTLEFEMTSFKRVHEYVSLEQEKEVASDRIDPVKLKNWPSRGEIEFQDIFMRYQPHLPDVLTNINLKIEAGERVGIVGRSGAGKSSILLALFRMVECHSGTIMIDNMDISGVPLSILRSKLSIIPQDPVLFSGTIRTNLDPFQLYSDNQIWDALRTASLLPLVQGLALKLDALVHEKGENFSVGHKQLFCLARALLKKSRILVLDEATANIDHKTDENIQRILRRSMSSSTLITIAHRLETVMDYDKLVVMSEGKIVEFGSPNELMSKVDGIFYGMARDCDIIKK